MRSRLSPPSDPLKPRISSAIIFAGNAVVFLVLSLLTQRMIYSFLFAVTFLLSVYEVVALRKQKRTQRGLHRRDYSDAEYRSLGMTRPQKGRRGAVQSAINVLLSLAIGAITLCTFTTNDPTLSPLLGAAMPFILILLDYNTVRFTWQEIREQAFRLSVYALSLGLFLYHLLAYFEVISLPLPEALRPELTLLLGLASFPLMLVMMYYIIRDTSRRASGRTL